MPSLRRIGGLATSVLVLGTVAVGSAATPAQAHPFGPPLTATVAGDGQQVDITWTGADDDWMALGNWTGAFGAATDTTKTGSQVLADSPEVRDYLLDHVRVSQSGQECGARWEQIDDVLEDGAHLVFDCPAPVVVVDVQVSAMTDVNEAYRTVVSSSGQQTLFTAAEPTHTLDLTARPGGDTTPVLLLSGAGVAILAAGGTWAYASRRRAGST